MIHLNKIVFALIIIATAHQVFSQDYKVLSTVNLKSDGPEGVETYQLIRSVLGPDPIETPDLYPDNHTGVKHIIEETDDIIGNHFTFLIHRDIDKDRDTDNTDRQRNEIKAYADSDNKLKAFQGESLRYHWFFQLDSGFSISKNFSHFFQLKAVGGDYASQPIVTISGSINSNKYQFEIMHSRLTGNEDVQLANTDWTKANSGKWMEMEVFATFADEGYLKILITGMGGDTIMAVEQENIDMWREGSDFVRPKWGIYRSLATKQYLNEDEERVRFADFSVQKVILNYIPVVPEQASNPYPANGAQFMDSALNLSWQPGNGAETHKLYLGVDSTKLDDFFIDSTTQNLYAVKGLQNLTSYYWRIDETNPEGTTRGKIWSFTTALKTVELIIQENEAGFVELDGTIENTFSGYTGEGYANSNDESGAKISWKIATAARGYYLKWRYANGNESNTSAFLKINDQAVGIVEFKPTGSWETWEMDSVLVNITPGVQTILLQAIANVGLANIDYLYVKGGDIEAITTAIKFKPSAITQLNVFPNPFHNELNVSFIKEKNSAYNMLLLNSLRQIIYQKHEMGASGYNNIRINIPELPQGIYFLGIINDSKTQIVKLIR